ncbi:hypothetical protein [Aliidiomarina quisquiliarum]|uniref:hypothetical protein n=1 Tax=Aliidiomarina quisquiliarum TaxID=2938947 RepID=UPI00208F5E0A|nr:hypothetical protein [Aliidiomarina quisquiliarum]MCO4322228.1 hypothetical protein [Aliidiomarina quisquiliarum]
MKHSVLNKRLGHPGLWGHESVEAKKATIPELNTDQLWATVSSMRHQDNQWVTLIGRPSADFLTQLASAGINKERIRCITPSSTETAVWATEQALLLNNSQLVIAWLGHCSPREEKRLQLVSRNSKSVNFLFTSPLQNPPLH